MAITPNLGLEATVLNFVDLPSPDPQRQGKTDRVFLVKVGSDMRVNVRLPLETLSDDALRAAIRAALEERKAWQGKALKL